MGITELTVPHQPTHDRGPATAKPGRGLYVAVEGATGAGKSTLVRRLAPVLGAETVYDPFEDNPFLTRLYRQQSVSRTSDLTVPTELTFVGLRIAQLRNVDRLLRDGRCALADWALFKQEIFAGLTMPATDAERVRATCAVWSEGLPLPDLVVHLHATEPTLAARIASRGRAMETAIDCSSLTALRRAYEAAVDRLPCPVVTIDADSFDVFADRDLTDVARTIRDQLHLRGKELNR